MWLWLVKCGYKWIGVVRHGYWWFEVSYAWLWVVISTDMGGYGWLSMGMGCKTWSSVVIVV